jgi:hypothetical protein
MEAAALMNFAEAGSKDGVTVEFSMKRSTKDMEKLGLRASDDDTGDGVLTHDQVIKVCKDPTVKWIAHRVRGDELKLSK